MPPTILREGAYRLFFSREEPRMHVHVAHLDGEATSWTGPEPATAVVGGLTPRQVADAEDIAQRTCRISAMPWSATSVAAITHVSRHGFRLLLGAEEVHVPFSESPWFRAATIEPLTTVG